MTATTTTPQPKFSGTEPGSSSAKRTKTASVASHPDLPGVTAEFVLVTPKIAAEFLAQNRANRRVRGQHYSAQARDIAEGNWYLTGDTIKRGPGGELLDGQHRCEAIIAANAPAWCLVVTGIKPEAQKVMDTGAARNVADYLTMQGIPNGALAASITRKWWGWRRGETIQIAHLKASHSEVLATFLECQAEILDAVSFAIAVRSRAKELSAVTPTIWGLSLLIFAAHSDDMAPKWFLEHVGSGEELKGGDPALALRRRLISAMSDNERLGEKELLYLIITAWNAFRGHKQIYRLQRPKGGVTAANFPGVE